MEADSSQSQQSTDWQQWLARHWHRPMVFALLLAAAVIGANFPVVFGGETFVLRDYSLFGYPLALHVKESLLAGEFPLWSPYNECGHPFLAQWNTMALYPPGWLGLAFPLSWFLGVFCLAHQYFGGLGMYFLARKWTRNSHGACAAAIIYAFNGIMQNCLMWPNNISALGWLPWVMLAVHHAWQKGGRSVLIAALVSTLQMLTGAPEIILATWVMLSVILFSDLIGRFRRENRTPLACLVRLPVIVVTTALLAAAQLIPFFDVMLQSPRFKSGEQLEWFIHWYGWASYFLPYFENIGPQPSDVIFQASQSWTHSYYLGLLPWLLLLPALAFSRAKLPWILLGGSALAIILAMGPEGGIYTVLDKIFPLEVMRYPVKILVACCFTFPLLAAFGIRRMTVPRVRDLNVQSIVAVVMVFAAAVLLMEKVKLPERGIDLGKQMVKFQIGWLIASAAGLLLVARFRGAQRSLFLLGLCVLLFADLKFHQTSLSPSIPAEDYEAPHPLSLFESAKYPHGRILPSMETQRYNLFRKSEELPNAFRGDRLGSFANINRIGGFAQVDGFYSIWLPHFADVYWKLFNGKFHYHDRLADFMGVTLVNTTRGPHDWMVRDTAQPQVTAGRRPIFLQGTNIADRLQSPDYDPAEVVFFTPDLRGVIPTNAVPEAKVSDALFSPHEISFRISTPQETIVTIAQTHYHWWQADIDGAPTPIHPANRAFQGMVVPAGEHTVTLRYIDQGFRVGSVISIVTLLTCLGLLFWPRSKQK
ncbi:MAG: YfhO family protein [Limisphaerales bacterium]